MKAWTYQDDKQVKKHGAKKASWYVGWIDPDGKRRCQSCGSGSRGKMLAEKVRKKTEAELMTGTYQTNKKKTWEDFREEYDAKIIEGMNPGSRRILEGALAHFERIINPKRMSAIKTQTIDAYRAERRTERGQKEGEFVSPATINKELRHLRAVIHKAHKWKYLTDLPDFDFEREPKRLASYVTGEHFAAMYGICDQAELPKDQPYPAADWWRALLVTGYMTGWRISELMALARPDLDMDAGFAITRADDNKGNRDERVKLHAVVVQHLKKLAGFDQRIFPWNSSMRNLYAEFARLQKAAGIHLPCDAQHKHSEYCYVYGFHDLRRAFATMNADKLTPDALQALMRHKSYLTTQKYINMARQMDAAVASLHVPDVLSKAKA